MDITTDTVPALLQGAIDMHVHHGPAAYTVRRLDAREAAVQADAAGMRAIVLKSREYPTAPIATMLNQGLEHLTVFGSVCLELEVGGLNPAAIETSARLGAKVVWMPTFSAANHQKATGGSGGISILDASGKVVPAVHQCLDVIIQYDMVLATGHLGTAEVFALVGEATGKGLKKIIITHPLNAQVGTVLSLEEQRQLAEMGAFIEHCLYGMMPFGGRLDPFKVVAAVTAVGAGRCILTTDLGQVYNPAPAEGMRMLIAIMLRCGLVPRDIELMVKTNPARLLGEVV